MKKLLIASTLSLFSIAAQAEMAIIVNPNNNVDLDAKIVRYIFLAKYKKFPNGEVAIPLDLPGNSAEYNEILEKLLRKDQARLNSYWARMMFSGKGKPPKPVDSSAEMKKTVSENPNTIGYIDARDVDDTVKVVLRLP